MTTDPDRLPSGDAYRAAVLGSPIAHSLSPVLHRAGYAALGLTHRRYDAYQVDEAALPDFVARLDRTWAGLSLTMPLKRAVIPLLDEISETARSVDAVNTLLLDEDGTRRGENTDVPGMVAALAERGVTAVGDVAILGAGATASSALAALASIPHDTVTVFARTPAKAESLLRLAADLGLDLDLRRWDQTDEALAADLIIATAPAGAADALAGRVREAPGTLFEVVYAPWPTPLVAAYAARGGRIVGGLDLLVHQATIQLELMTGVRPAPLAAMRSAGEAELAKRARANTPGESTHS